MSPARTHHHRSRLAVALGLLLGLGALVWAPCGASAQREHTVRPGQSLARIARRYGISVSALAAANRLRRNAQIRPGQTLRVPNPGEHYVQSGETLASIARNNDTTVAALTRHNHLRAGRSLRIGQRLILPGHEAAEEQEAAASRWGRPRRAGVASLYRREIDTRLRVRLLDSRGRVRRAAVRRIRELMRPRNRHRRGRLGRMGPAPPRRLVEILARISDHFGGREISIVSGYRSAGGYTRASSRHTRGHALDIRLRGVPNEELRDFVRSAFNNVGVGYYPRSHFVHVDVRERSSYWVDWSRPGQRPQYQRRGDSPPADASPDEVQATGIGGDDDDGEDDP